MTFQRSIDSLIDEFLLHVENQAPDVDRSAGSLTRVFGSGVGSCLWGVYNRLEFLARQISPDSAESARLEHHCDVRGLTRADGETDSALLTRLLSILRQPPAGGNQYDWPRWAKEVTYGTETCTKAWLDENARGQGTINVVIASDRSEDPDDYSAWANATAYSAGDVVKDDSITGAYRAYIATTSGTSSGTGVDDDTGVSWEDAEEYASSGLVAEVTDYLDAKRPVGIWDFAVYSCLKNSQDVAITVTGDDADTAVIAAAIETYMETIVGGKGLYTGQLVYIAIEAGAENAVVTTPAADVSVAWGPTSYERIWPGQITVST